MHFSQNEQQEDLVVAAARRAVRFESVHSNQFVTFVLASQTTSTNHMQVGTLWLCCGTEWTALLLGDALNISSTTTKVPIRATRGMRLIH